ncbi:T7SS effector LXG polymorphic toxin [Fictibacillus sp. b24]|uniref:ribonuclease YeeF family protein n=1 Tax=Fictibacillus sp. b24 TaxID=3055863 RepID=UPI0025A0E032|nr:T7SS effector LXG polymorphic toxin [Fictibacillus sp. b24]MDM5318075.1 T7SS effector LXG polymorphic toxin [Fictibacillus sp. b24]
MVSKVFEAATLQSATTERAQQYESLKEQFLTLKKEFGNIVDNHDFEGHGAEAIKGFYQGQMDVVDAWIRFLDTSVSFFKGIPGDTEDVDLSGDTLVQVPFLDDNVERAGKVAKEMVAEQQDALQRIFNGISDLVSLSVFSKDNFDDQMDQSEKKRSETVEKVNELDQRLSQEYAYSQNQEQHIYGLFAQLMEATRRGENISPLYFNAEAYRSSEVYKGISQAEQDTSAYLASKKKQQEDREIAKKIEEMENRPWHEKAWDTVCTFTGEVTGYYDTIRASTGVDPVTGRKLSEAERITAGAMAAAGFIPVIGWAGRAAKGGSAIYKTVRAVNTADHMLDSYKTAQGLSRLQKAEYGIYGLVSANGFGEYFTGKDMFGNELTEEQRNQSLFNAFAIAGVGSAGYALDDVALRNKNYNTPPVAADLTEVPRGRYADRLDYLRSKYGSLTKEELHARINKPGIRRMLNNYSPSQKAQEWQGVFPYVGTDEYIDKVYKKGTILYAGEPYPTGYFSTKEAIEATGKDAKVIFEGLQVKPYWQKGMDHAIYRGQMGAYKLNIDLIGANGIAKSNPQFGQGGMEQIFMSDFNELVHNKYITRVDNAEIQLHNVKITYEEYELMLNKIQ